MDSELCIDENDAPFLIDSGTESITESPLDTEHSEDSTLCDINVRKYNTTHTYLHKRNLKYINTYK